MSSALPFDPARKVIIAGTGRCGTTFLIQLLTLLGCDTGLVHRDGRWFHTVFQDCRVAADGEILHVDRRGPAGVEFFPTMHDAINAGCETHFAPDDTADVIAALPKYIKNPRLAWLLHRYLDAELVQVEHVIVPVRDLGAVASSKLPIGRVDPSQTWYHRDVSALRSESGRELGELVTTLITRDIPHSFIAFPRLIDDPVYCHDRLLPVLPPITYTDFLNAFRLLADESKVHHR